LVIPSTDPPVSAPYLKSLKAYKTKLLSTQYLKLRSLAFQLTNTIQHHKSNHQTE